MKHSYQKGLSMLLIATLVALILAGCGRTANETKEPATPTGTPEPTNNPGKTEPTLTQEATPSAEPTGTPEPTKAPDPTSTPEPTEAPKPTATPEPTEAPKPTATPEPTKVPDPTVTPEPTPAETVWNSYSDMKNKALSALSNRLAEAGSVVYVYKDYSSTENHFTQKAKIYGYDESLVCDMDENWQNNAYSGNSCIRCKVSTYEGDWGGWMFMNGYLPKGAAVPLLNDGSMDGQGLDLTGADALRFYARGENGGETLEFYCLGFGYASGVGRPVVDYPDSSKTQSLGEITLTKDWKEYVIPLDGVDLSYIVNGFSYVTNDVMNGNTENVFYLDEICFTGDITSAKEAPVLMRSYDTENVYLKQTCFSYYNAVAAMAFLSEGKQKEAKKIVDAFVYAVENDRSLFLMDNAKKRVRNAYAAGGIEAFPGWVGGARLPGWYNNEEKAWNEDRTQVGSNVGNTSFVALALLQYYNCYGGDRYLNTARDLMDWVIASCSDGRTGFTGGFDGWEEGNLPVVYPFTYRSIEHNIDAYAVFKALYEATGEKKYDEAAQSAKTFILSMYDEKKGCFLTGTGEDGVTPNRTVTVLDAQVWCALALGEEFQPYADAMKTVETMKNSQGGYGFCTDNKGGGTWCEGTAYTALLYRILGDNGKYEEAMNALSKVQLKNGMFPAATIDHLPTGMYLFDGSPWEYSTDPHIVGGAWMIMAANGYNPYVMKH